MILQRSNLRFTSSAYHPQDPDNEAWLVDVERISDGHRLPRQMWFDSDPTADEMWEASDEWIAKHPGLDREPPAVHCLACGVALESDADTNYQFDNALWIGFHGGYAMFTDSMADFPTNTDEQWLRDKYGEYLTQGRADGSGVEAIPNPDYVPEYEEERVLPGRPDHEAVICHECAHRLCAQNQWIDKLIEPLRSHSHRYKDHPRLRAEGHMGWDLDRETT